MESVKMIAGALQILLVEDSPSDVRLTREAFKDAKPQVEGDVSNTAHSSS